MSFTYPFSRGEVSRWYENCRPCNSFHWFIVGGAPWEAWGVLQKDGKRYRSPFHYLDAISWINQSVNIQHCSKVEWSLVLWMLQKIIRKDGQPCFSPILAVFFFSSSDFCFAPIISLQVWGGGTLENRMSCQVHGSTTIAISYNLLGRSIPSALWHSP